MKNIFKILPLVAAITTLAVSCDKKDDLPFYNNGNPVTLSGSAATVTPAVADSLKTALTLSWTSPSYATTESTYKYIIQIDTGAASFARPFIKEVTGVTSTALSSAFTAKDLNTIALSFGLGLGKSADLSARVISSYGNNNERYTSNTFKFKLTPYSYAFPLNASDAGPFTVSISNRSQILQTLGWAQPSYGSGSYTFTYSLQYDSTGKNFASPKTVAVTAGTSIEMTGETLNTFAKDKGIAIGKQGSLDFRVVATINGGQSVYSAVRTFKVTPAELLMYLYVPGGYQGWAPESAPKLASVAGVEYEGYINMTATDGFKFTSAPDWGHTNYGNGGAGKLTADGSAGNLTVPAVGYYLFKADLSSLTWTATPITTWGLIGDATPGGWNTSTPLTYDAANKVWKGTVTLSGTGAFKFRANNGWDINLGGTGATLTNGGDNIPTPGAGTYTVTLNLSNPLQYTYSVVK